MGYRVTGPDINASGASFRPQGLQIRYSLLGIKDVGVAAVSAIEAAQPFDSWEDFRKRMVGTKCNLGHIKHLARVGAFDSLYPNRRQLEVELTAEGAGDFARCVDWDVLACNTNDLPCRYDWTNEPLQLTKAGKPRKVTVPKSCTKACRQYRPIGNTLPVTTPYTDADIRDVEMEYLGLWLSSSPFDRLEEDYRKICYTGSEIEVGPPGDYVTAAIIKKVKPAVDRRGGHYAWITLDLQDAVIDVPCFASNWGRLQAVCKPGVMGYLLLSKSPDGRMSMDNDFFVV